MENAVYDALKEKLGDAKIKVGEEEKGLLELVAYWEEGVEKTKAANKDLTTQRETWEKERKEFKTNLETLSTVKGDLEKQLEELKKGGKGNTQEKEDFTRQINALTEQINTMTASQKAAEQKAKDAEERAQQANKMASEEGLRKDLMTELANHKIIGTQADFAVTTIMAKGLAKLVTNDSGLYQRSFCTQKDGKELAADLSAMCKWFADSNTFLVSGSGKPGTGMPHDANKPATNGRPTAVDMLKMK